MNQDNPQPHGSEVPDDNGSEATASGPQSDESPLTVDDIVNEPQSEAAQQQDAVEAEQDGEAEADVPYLEDLRRVTAEYANYRRRTEANAERDQQRATARVISSLLPVLDDLDRAEKHGDLVEGSAIATIAQKLRTNLEKLGLERFGEAGEPFHPAQHEAIAQVPTPGTESATVLDVIEAGYRIGEVELRPAKVAVAVSADG